MRRAVVGRRHKQLDERPLYVVEQEWEHVCRRKVSWASGPEEPNAACAGFEVLCKAASQVATLAHIEGGERPGDLREMLQKVDAGKPMRHEAQLFAA